MRRALIAVGVIVAAAVAYAGYAVASSSSDPSASCDPPSYDGTNLNLHCTIPQVTNTVTETDTATVTETATETQTVTATETVPGPTSTVTETQTVTVTPTPPPPPPPPAFFAPGEAMNATNTGYAGDGLTAADLTPQGSITYGSAYNGQTITRKAYTGEVDITGTGITVKDCSLTNGGKDTFGINIFGVNDRVDHCTITSPAGQSMYEPVFFQPGSNGGQATYNNISRGAQAMTTYGANVTFANNYTHDTSIASDNTQHPDGIEIYGGSNILIRDNRIEEDNLYDSPVNVAPWGSYKVQGLTVQGNFLDNGQAMTLIDNQNGTCPGATGNCLINVKVIGNAMGGHTCPASNNQCFDVYKALENYENRPIVQDDAGLAANANAIEWPGSGANANEWQETQTSSPPLTPNRDGQVVKPSCPSPC
jgi:hypothetical protein